MKARLFVSGEHIFYYPDVMVTCDPRDTERQFKAYPKVIIEVLSEATERIDRHEKFSNYSRIESLPEYVLASQEKIKVTVFRRSQDWKAEVLGQQDQQLRLDSLDFQIRLGTIYESVSI